MKASQWISSCGILILNCFSLASMSYASDESYIDMLNLTDRGSITDTPYVIPNKSLLIESGYQYLSLKIDGPLYNVPQTTTVSLGVNFNTEIFVIFPTYYFLSKPEVSGFDTPSFGVKHEFMHGHNWLVSLQGIGSMSGGSDAFGHQGAGGQLNALATYSINSSFDVSGMFGVSTSTEASAGGGAGFSSLNPSIALSYKPAETTSVFVELFGQTKAGYFVGSVFGTDCGLVYQFTKNASLDFEVVKNISSNLLYYNYYLASGITVLF